MQRVSEFAAKHDDVAVDPPHDQYDNFEVEEQLP
jgi:hypothetical protein